MSFDRFVANRYLRAKRKQSFIGVISIITLVGITLGVAALNVALAIHNGMRGAFITSLVGETGNLYVVANSLVDYGWNGEEVQKLGKTIGEVPGVQAISMMRQEPGVLVSKQRRLNYCKLYGVMPKTHMAAAPSLRQLEAGSLTQLERAEGLRPGIVLGKDLADDLGVRLGDDIRVMVPRLSSPGLGMRPGALRLKELKCEVVGLFKTGNSQFDASDAYLLLDQLLMVLGTDEIQSILVNFQTLDDMEIGKAALRAHPGLLPSANVVDLRDLNQGLLSALALEKLATTAVISLFILIVALNMISALTMLVMEKHRDIGIMRAFGTPRATIMRIFLRQGMTLSVWGTVLGSVLGVVGALVADATKLIKLDNNVYEVLSYLPFVVRPHEVLLVALGSLLISLLTCLFPARQAARMDPVEALAYE